MIIIPKREVFEIWFFRRMLRKVWMDQVTSGQKKEKVANQRHVTKNINNYLLQIIMQCRMVGKLSVGSFFVEKRQDLEQVPVNSFAKPAI